MPRMNLVGQRFGRYLVIDRAGTYGVNNASCFLCRCDCGTEKVVMGANLKTKSIVSCGCWRRERAENGEVGRIHGHSRSNNGKSSPTYSSWCGMKDRCYNKNCSEYFRYGEKGIVICDRWRGREGFLNFLADMGERPEGKTIDRFPNRNGNYEPGNCRWATPLEQTLNREATIKVIWNGEERYFIDVCDETGTNRTKAYTRLVKGFSLEDVFRSENIGSWEITDRGSFLTFNGKTMRIADWSRETGIKEVTIAARVNRYGWSVEKALTLPPNKANRI